ncbi:MAG: hypothetical protein AAFQ43_01635 [Bacteroidota bacterium]
MPRFLLAPLALGLLFLATDARGQSCPTGLAIGPAVNSCLHVDASCETDNPMTTGSFSLNGESCIPHNTFTANADCDGTGVSMGGLCVVWRDENAPEAAEARALLQTYADGRSPASASCASGLSVGSACVRVSPVCTTGLADAFGACYGFAPDASCEGTGVFLSGGGGEACAEWTNRDGADAPRAEAALASLREGRLTVTTDPTDLPAGFGTYPAHLTPECMDGVDNDGDGATDYPEAGCTSPFDHEEAPEAGEGETFQFFKGPAIDGGLMRTSQLYCNAPENRERFAADRLAILDYWHLQALQNDLVPVYDYLAEGDDTEFGDFMASVGERGREYRFSSRHPVEREWNGQVDFAFGWGRGQSMEVSVACNYSGISDIRSWGGLGTRGAEGGDQRKSWGPFEPEKYRMQVGDPDVRVTEFRRLDSSYLRGFRPSPLFYGSAEVSYFTPNRHYIVTVKTRSGSGGYAARMNTPDGFRMVAAPVSIGPWNICTAGELTEPASSLTCENNPGRAEISDPPDASPYIK